MGRPRSGGCKPASLVSGHDWVSDPPLVGTTPGCRNLLDPPGGREARRAEPPGGVGLKLLARDADPGHTSHELAEILGEGGPLLDARADLRGCNLGAVLGVAPRVPLTEEAGADQTRNGQRQDQRYWCDLAQPHALTFREIPTILLLRRRR